jgi:hypothetical protein
MTSFEGCFGFILRNHPMKSRSKINGGEILSPRNLIQELIESASRPLVDFVVLNDNLIK